MASPCTLLPMSPTAAGAAATAMSAVESTPPWGLGQQGVVWREQAGVAWDSWFGQGMQTACSPGRWQHCR
eukprot:scaffold53458_cov22-Tisochrysis_lutea.AAC.1